MIRPDLGCYLAVVSHLRPANVGPMTDLVGPATWYVGAGEAPAYAAAGAPAIVESGPLCRSRNAALNDAAAHGLACVQASDDLRRIDRAHVDPARPARALGFADAVRMLLDGIASGPARLAGVAPTANAFYFNPRRPVTTAGFIVGDLFAAAPCEVRFDEALRIKEDYDFTLRHLDRFGAVHRRNDILAAFAHRTNPGGAVAVRTPELERITIAALKARWGDFIRDNPRRPGEILLRWRPIAAVPGIEQGLSN